MAQELHEALRQVPEEAGGHHRSLQFRRTCSHLSCILLCRSSCRVASALFGLDQRSQSPWTVLAAGQTLFWLHEAALSPGEAFLESDIKTYRDDFSPLVGTKWGKVLHGRPRGSSNLAWEWGLQAGQSSQEPPRSLRLRLAAEEH